MDPYDFVVATVREAGELLMKLRGEKFETLEKGGDPRDIVTSVDFAVNNFVIKKIKDAYPNDAIYSEEGGGVVAGANSWAIDPIDGTANFARNIPHFAVCLAYLEAGEPTAGAVFNPVTNELFSFTKGGGAFLNGKSIHVSNEKELKNSFVLLHAGRKQELCDWGAESYRKLLKEAKKTSNLASSALDACFVAAGRIEANIYGTLSALDIAAAVGILQEAGGRIVNKKGESTEFSTEPQTVLMTNNKEIESTLLKLLF